MARKCGPSRCSLRRPLELVRYSVLHKRHSRPPGWPTLRSAMTPVLEGFSENPRMKQFLERLGAVAHGVFLRRVYFGKGLLHAVGDKDGVITEAAITARRESEVSMHF